MARNSVILISSLCALYTLMYVWSNSETDGVKRHWNFVLGISNRIQSNPESQSMSYKPPPAAQIQETGKPFTAEARVLTYMGLDRPQRFFRLTPDTAGKFVFVTAADSSHYNESKDAVASVQKYFPGYPIHFYDIGLEPGHRQEVAKWCHVTVHNFVFHDSFPQHVHNKGLICWKFLLIKQALDEFGAIFWVDASFRAKDPAANWDDVFDLAQSNGGIVMTQPTYNPLSNFAWTDPAMYDFLPTDTERQKSVRQICACSVLIYNTETVFHHVLRWMYLCSLEPTCCPRSSPPVKFAEADKYVMDRYKAHRHDQSALNLLLSNHFGYDVSKYVPTKGHQVISRRPTESHALHRCF